MTTILIPGKFNALARRIWTGVATAADMEGVADADVIAIKSDCEHTRIRYVPSGLVRKPAKANAEGVESRSVDHVASDETPDRMGDIIRVAGWQLDEFRKNPMLLWMHDHNHPIGLVDSAKRGKTDDGRKALLTTSTVHGGEKSLHGLDNDVLFKLISDGDLPAVSVGFQPLETYRPETEEERAKIGLGRWGVVYESAGLLELSVVSIGANPNALKRSLERAVEGGRLAAAEFDGLLGKLQRAFEFEVYKRAPRVAVTVPDLSGAGTSFGVSMGAALRRAIEGSGIEISEAPEEAPVAAPASETSETNAPVDETPAPADDTPPQEPETKADASETPAAAPVATDPAIALLERLVAATERIEASNAAAIDAAKSAAETQTKLSDALAALSTKLEEISRAAGAGKASVKPSQPGSPAGADKKPTSRGTDPEGYFRELLDKTTRAVREAVVISKPAR